MREGYGGKALLCAQVDCVCVRCVRELRALCVFVYTLSIETDLTGTPHSARCNRTTETRFKVERDVARVVRLQKGNRERWKESEIKGVRFRSKRVTGKGITNNGPITKNDGAWLCRC